MRLFAGDCRRRLPRWQSVLSGRLGVSFRLGRLLVVFARLAIIQQTNLDLLRFCLEPVDGCGWEIGALSWFAPNGGVNGLAALDGKSVRDGGVEVIFGYRCGVDLSHEIFKCRQLRVQSAHHLVALVCRPCIIGPRVGIVFAPLAYEHAVQLYFVQNLHLCILALALQTKVLLLCCFKPLPDFQIHLLKLELDNVYSMMKVDKVVDSVDKVVDSVEGRDAVHLHVSLGANVQIRAYLQVICRTVCAGVLSAGP